MKNLITLFVLAATAAAASAQCSSHGGYRNNFVSHHNNYATQSYHAPYVAPFYQPVAIYVVPGAPVATINAYGQLAVVQPVAVAAPAAVATAPAYSHPAPAAQNVANGREIMRIGNADYEIFRSPGGAATAVPINAQALAAPQATEEAPAEPRKPVVVK